MRCSERGGSVLRRGRRKISPVAQIFHYLLGNEADAGIGVNGLEQRLSDQVVITDVGTEFLRAPDQECGLLQCLLFGALIHFPLALELVDQSIRLCRLRARVGLRAWAVNSAGDREPFVTDKQKVISPP